MTRFLERIGYGALDRSEPRAGQFRRRGSTLDVFVRGFALGGESFAARRVRLHFAGSRLVAIEDDHGRRVDRLPAARRHRTDVSDPDR